MLLGGNHWQYLSSITWPATLWSGFRDCSWLLIGDISFEQGRASRLAITDAEIDDVTDKLNHYDQIVSDTVDSMPLRLSEGPLRRDCE